MYPALHSHAVSGGAEPTDEFGFCWSHHFTGLPSAHPSLTTPIRVLARQSVALRRQRSWVRISPGPPIAYKTSNSWRRGMRARSSGRR